MVHLVFAQELGPRVDAASLDGAAQRHFRATLRVLPAAESGAGGPTRVELQGPHGVKGSFGLSVRPRTADDLARAQVAEERGRAAGMAGLAERCASVWEVEPEAGVDLSATLMLCAIIASVALGPVLPPDDSTLFGVRGAMERVERLLDRAPDP